MADICTRDNLIGIEMKATTTCSKLHNEAESRHMFYMKNTKEVMKRQLALGKPHQMVSRPPMFRAEDTGSIEANPCFHPIHTNKARDIWCALK